MLEQIVQVFLKIFLIFIGNFITQIFKILVIHYDFYPTWSHSKCAIVSDFSRDISIPKFSYVLQNKIFFPVNFPLNQL
jgi:hypothetical protein